MNTTCSPDKPGPNTLAGHDFHHGFRLQFGSLSIHYHQHMQRDAKA
ncbi:MAG: hypothetical protein NC111_03800 [Bacteroides sp.]|nr:hypothetical protein [Bacteroides sp.]MCM1413940.1 hypothetical protein [Bacteroides sp.]MCM1471633.1 hypothetical protein [Bacteroides sp.]